MKPVLQTTQTGSGAVDHSVVCLGLVGSEHNPIGDAEWIQEAIDRRANSVGQVLEDIMQDMEVHSRWGINE